MATFKSMQLGGEPVVTRFEFDDSVLKELLGSLKITQKSGLISFLQIEMELMSRNTI